jgi:hypothetical protein
MSTIGTHDQHGKPADFKLSHRPIFFRLARGRDNML